MATAAPTQAPEDNNNTCGTNRESKRNDAWHFSLFLSVVEFCGESLVRCDHGIEAPFFPQLA